MKSLYIIYCNSNLEYGYYTYRNPIVLDTDQLVPFLANYVPALNDMQLDVFLKRFDAYILYVRNVVKISRAWSGKQIIVNLEQEPDKTKYSQYKHLDADKSIHELTKSELKNKLLKAVDYYKARQKFELFPDQIKLLAQKRELNKYEYVPFTNYGPNKYGNMKPRSHSNSKMGKGERADHTQSAFAKYNHFYSSLPKLIEYRNLPFRHRNRSYTKKHPVDFPQFDDDELITARHSTGWKHSAKCKKQYQTHLRKPSKEVA